MSDVVGHDSNRLVPSGVIVTPVTGVTAAVAIPPSWIGRFISLRAEGGSIVFKLGDSTVTVDPSDVDPTKIGWKQLDGEAQDWRIADEFTFIAVASPDGSASMRWGVSSDKNEGAGALT